MEGSMSRLKLFTIGQLAKQSGVTVRTLHHYDDIGLLKPAKRGTSGRRLYDSDCVLRLQQIMTYRTLGLALSEITKLLDDPNLDRRAVLVAQRKAVADQIERAETLIRGIDEALALIDRQPRKDMDMTTLFGGFDPSQFEDEAKARWGETREWAISAKRTSQYSDEDWARYQTEHDAICKGFADLARQDGEASSTTALHYARAYADLIDRWFYPCNPRQMAALADMYEGDARFRATFDKHGEGTSAIVIEAFRAYAAAE